jgi:hypothetical protein
MARSPWLSMYRQWGWGAAVSVRIGSTPTEAIARSKRHLHDDIDNPR